MRRYWRPFIGMLILVALLLGNLYIYRDNQASAHFGAHWHRNAPLYLNVANYASRYSLADAAINDQYQNISALYWIKTTSNVNVFVFDGDYGVTNWCGAAFVDAPGGHIQGQPEAKYNGDPQMNCGQNDPYFIQGVFYQELAHTWGQGHHNQGTNGTCMALNYFGTGTNYRVSDHDNADFNAIYTNHIP